MKINELKVNILLSIFALFKTNIHIHLVVHSVNIQTLSDENYYNDKIITTIKNLAVGIRLKNIDIDCIQYRL